MVQTAIITAIIGIAVGVISGMLGVGGGMVMVPLFRLAYGMSAVASTATSLFTIIPTSLTGAISHVRAKTCVPKLGIALGVGGACTSPVGVWLAQMAPPWLVMVATAVCIGFASYTMLNKALKMPKEPDRAAAGQQGDASSAGRTTAAGAPLPVFSTKKLLLGALIGAVAGVASGFVGLGGGFIMIPLMTVALDLPMKMASGTSLIAVMILALPASVAQCLLGNVDFVAGIAMACGSIPGALVGAKLVRIVPERMLRLMFAGFLFIAALLLIVKETGVLG